MQTVRFSHTRLDDGFQVLDLGCGEGRHTVGVCLYASVHAVGVDLSLNDLMTAKEQSDSFLQTTAAEHGISLLCANGMTLPFADSCFDIIVCAEVLEHIPEYEQMLDEIMRVLKPGGELVVSVPRFWPEWICWRLSDEYHSNKGGHIRIFRDSQLRKAIEHRGLSFKLRHWAHALHSPYWWLQCALWESRDQSRLVSVYRRFLEWDILQKPWLTRALERMLDPLMGKSVVMYFTNENF